MKGGDVVGTLGGEEEVIFGGGGEVETEVDNGAPRHLGGEKRRVAIIHSGLSSSVRDLK